MAYYLLPRTSFFTSKYIDCVMNEEPPSIFVSNSLSTYLYNIKEKLNKQRKDWDIYKKYTNPYEYIHTIVPYKKQSISKHRPLSRSYFKMIEIMKTFSIMQTPTNMPIKSFHLAEGPGGFIEALVGLRNCKQDIYIGMTILDYMNDSNIPAWKKSDKFLRDNENVYVECGADNTGNILSIENFEYCREKYGSSMDLITADGGFDFSSDFNNQEISISRLLFAQMCFALVMQKRGGSFILKIFDSFMEHTIDILYILSAFYKKVYYTKPNTSRYANSEKYIVCKGFLFTSNEQFYPYLYAAFSKMLSTDNADSYIHRFLKVPISYNFLLKIEEYNAIFGQQQIENINYTISLIDSKNKLDKIDNILKIHIQKSIQWCIKYGIEYNNLTFASNIFSTKEYNGANAYVEDVESEVD